MGTFQGAPLTNESTLHRDGSSTAPRSTADPKVLTTAEVACPQTAGNTEHRGREEKGEQNELTDLQSEERTQSGESFPIMQTRCGMRHS